MKTEVPSLLKTQVEYLCVEYESKLMMLKMTEFIKMYYFLCITNSCEKKKKLAVENLISMPL